MSRHNHNIFKVKQIAIGNVLKACNVGLGEISLSSYVNSPSFSISISSYVENPILKD